MVYDKLMEYFMVLELVNKLGEIMWYCYLFGNWFMFDGYWWKVDCIKIGLGLVWFICEWNGGLWDSKVGSLKIIFGVERFV